jgi:transcription elongation factor GreB
MDSPLAKALFKKTLDDEISIEVPGGKKSYVIVAISYRDFETV